MSPADVSKVASDLDSLQSALLEDRRDALAVPKEVATHPTGSVPSGDLDRINLGCKTDKEQGAEASRRMTDRVRLYEIAREMGCDNREVLEVCEQLGIPFKSHSSTISPEQAELVRSKLSEPRVVKPTRPRLRPKLQPESSQPQPPVEAKASERPQHIVGIRRPAPAQQQAAAGEASSSKPSPQRPDQLSSEKGAAGGSLELIGPPRRQVDPPARPAAQEPQPAAASTRPEAAAKAGSPEPSPAPAAKRPTVLPPPSTSRLWARAAATGP